METKDQKKKRIRNRKSRSKGLRANTGCLTCRKRHLKCNEARPKCQQCEKSDRACEYKTAREESRKEDARPKVASGTLPVPRRAELHVDTLLNSTDEETEAEAIQQEEVIENPQWTFDTSNQVAADSRDSSHAQSLPPVQSPQNVTAPSGVIMHSTPDGAYNDPDALYRTTSNQTIALPPIMGGDQTISHTSPNFSIGSVSSMSFEMTHDETISKWFDLLAGDASIDLGKGLEPLLTPDSGQPLQLATPNEALGWSWSTNLPRSLDPVPAENEIWRSHENLELQFYELQIFRNFIDTVPSWMDLLDPLRHFSVLAPRLALRNIGLMNAILALSIRHLSLNSQFANGLMYSRNEALQYYHAALKYVGKAMQYDSYNRSDELLATSLIISAYEMLDGSRRDWERHLQGVFWIQRSSVTHGDSGGFRAAIWWSWLCQDCWAAFKDKRAAFTFWRPERTGFRDMSAWELAQRSVFIFKSVVGYCADEKQGDLSITFNKRMEHAQNMSKMMDEWRACLPIEFEPLPSEPEPEGTIFPSILIHPAAFAAAMQVHYASIILLALHRPVLGGMDAFLKQQNLLNDCVAQICGIAKGLHDNASSILSSQCLYIAGMCTHDVPMREEIVRLIKLCRARVGWPTRCLSEELWEIWMSKG